MASKWAQERLRKWHEVIDINQRQIGFRIPELLDEVRKETAARCAEIASERARRWHHQAAVKDFMVKFGQYRQDKPGWPPQEVLDLRIRLIAEEFAELLAAAGYEGNMRIARFNEECEDEIFHWYHVNEDAPDFPAFVDAHADLDYVLSGTLEACGVQGQPVWDEVHAANMRKEGGATREDGKICKPEGWVGPDVERVLRQQGWEG